jgi:hypothetical protein
MYGVSHREGCLEPPVVVVVVVVVDVTAGRVGCVRSSWWRRGRRMRWTSRSSRGE